ncbi:hypothetical protein DSECCO2_512940 [anaerobic digester metagenome]
MGGLATPDGKTVVTLRHQSRAGHAVFRVNRSAAPFSGCALRSPARRPTALREPKRCTFLRVRGHPVLGPDPAAYCLMRICARCSPNPSQIPVFTAGTGRVSSSAVCDTRAGTLDNEEDPVGLFGRLTPLSSARPARARPPTCPGATGGRRREKRRKGLRLWRR